MAVVDVIKYDGPHDVYAWKYPNHELGLWTQLIVNESQEAILFKGGQALDLFTAGRHTLSTNNIPLLSKLINLPFGGNSPFTAEVWYINKIHSIDVKWGTRTPIQLQDPQYRLLVPVRSFGQFGIQIEDSRKFLLMLVGTVPLFDRTTLVEYFRGVLMTNIKELISSYLVHKKISVVEINAYISEISAHIKERIVPLFEEFGIRILNFFVTSINVPDDDPGVVRLKDALAKKAEMDIIGFNYQQERTFDTMESAAKNEGGAQGGLMGAGIGLGMGVGVGGAFGNTMNQMAQHIQMDGGAGAGRDCPKCGTKNNAGAKFCNNCGHNLEQTAAKEAAPASIVCDKCKSSIPKGSKFCPNCGDLFNPCPHCSADNPDDAAACIECGKPMPKKCGGCGESVPGGMKFCPHCGTPMVKKCANCQHELQPGQRFCPDCGTRSQE